MLHALVASVEVLSWEVQVGRLGAPGAFIGDGFGLLEGVVQLQGHPGMVPEDAVLHNHVVIALETSGLLVKFIDDALAVILQQFPQARIAMDGCPAIGDRLLPPYSPRAARASWRGK